MNKPLLKLVLPAVVLIIAVFWITQKQDANKGTRSIQFISGNTMGTTYSIKYDMPADLKDGIDSILLVFNQSLSTYIPDSEISQFNNGSTIKMELPYLYPVLKKSKEIYTNTNGAFDPTVMPLVRAWGFGPDEPDQPDSARVKELLTLVGMDSVFFDSVSLCKLKNDIQLDFSAIAKGYGVDVVMDYLIAKGAKNAMVEVGGETRAIGRNERDIPWQLGIDDPTKGLADREMIAVVSLNNMALATSGNYRNYYIKDGVKYAHTISPRTGFPVTHTLLSASVMAKDCMTADAYATAFMVMGKDEAIGTIERETEVEALLIYSNEKGELETYKSPGMKMGEE